MAGRIRGLLAALLALAMALGVAPGAALADEGGKAISGLGTSVIAAPEGAGRWSYVYYGKYAGQSVKYRVLAPSTTKFGGTTMLLDCDSILYTSKFHDNSNAWSGSVVKGELNGGVFLQDTNKFTLAEQAAIAPSTVESHELVLGDDAGNVARWTKDSFANYVALTGEKVFLLDAEDASNIDYGYVVADTSADPRVKKYANKESGHWWLRSASAIDSSYAGYVYSDGDLFYNDVKDTDVGVSPAFNIDLKSVIFSSLISGEAGQSGAEYKLTIKDDDLEVKEASATRSGKTATVSYAMAGKSVTGDTQASYVVLKNAWDAEENEVKGYGKLDPAGEGKGTFNLAAAGCGETDVWGTDYHVYVLAETVSEGEATDYASAPLEIEELTPTTFAVKVAEGIQGGTVTTDKSEAAEGDLVKISARADDGYELDTVTVTDADGRQVETKDGSFTMPDNDVTVSATFRKKASDVPPVSVTAHVQRKGTLSAVSGGAIAGTTGKSLRMESVRLTVDGASAAGGIEYRSHVQRKGWEKTWAKDGAMAGTEGKSRRMEAVQIRLWGDMAAKYDVYYRVHVQKYGWMAWAKNGQSAGTQGMSRRVEAIQVVLVAKDGSAPAKALKGATQQYAKAFVKK